ncbi:MAG: ABC-2 transporter permease [Oscillospiraceae bacterium]|nr:ABC-2 transporter permease [Oscillospiraceae bacterium]
MKGLLLKDLYQLWKYCRTFLLIVVVFLGVSFVSPENLFFSLYPAMICGVLPMTLLSYDERTGWNQYSAALPCSRVQIVSAKYLLGLMIEVVVLAVSLTATAVASGSSGAAGSLLTLGAILWFVGLVTPSILMPVVLWLGTEKGRIVYMFMIALIAGAGAAVMRTKTLESIQSVSSVPFAAMALGATVVYGLSWLLSIRLYQKKEF